MDDMTLNKDTNEMTQNIFAITASAAYVNQALEEAREVDKALKILQNYGNGILLAATTMTKEDFNNGLLNKKPVFIRHVSAFDAIVEINENMTKKEIAGMIMKHYNNIEKYSKIAVQIRKARGEYYFNPIDLKGEIDEILVEIGAEAEIKEPEYIISVLLDEANCYIGLSPSHLNISSWSGGMIHYKKEDADISRAKYKLMEAFSVFELDLSNIQNALDLGAAPGGWTSVLLEKKIAVTAVDTGDMDKRLYKFSNFTYIKANAAELELPENSFDLLTSDVSWNAKNTAVLVNKASKFLRDDGYAIITVKLMGDKVRRTIREVKEIYQEVFDVLATKQLFHNRDEVTLLLRKKSSI
jgi:23S rRNA (cytidine2498-2'-O)-methyltransferase